MSAADEQAVLDDEPVVDEKTPHTPADTLDDHQGNLHDTHEEKLSFSAVEPVDVHIRGLNVRVVERTWLKRKRTPDVEEQSQKRILADIDADFPRATLTGIIGSSGSGKTTLLNVLAHRMRSSNLHITGQLSPPISSITHAYVTQTDVLLPTLTVRETLQCAADLRLPASVSAVQRSQLVEEIILELGLKECADTQVGDGHRRRGCSGGERRRVSLGVQMLGNPSVLFLDEPTTGLDATSAYQLVKTLQSIAHKGRTVIMTLHQPRSEVYFMLDRIALLAKGGMLYTGDRDGAVPWFEDCSGTQLQAHINPGEYLIGMGPGVLTLKWREAAEKKFPLIIESKSHDSQPFDSPDIKDSRAPLQRTVYTLVSRTFRTSLRDPMGLTTSWIEAALMGLVVGLVFLQLPESQSGIRSREAAAYTAVGLQGYLMVMFEVYRLTVIELPVFDREHSEGVVAIVPWMLSYRLSHLFLEDMIVPFIFAVITYWMMGLAKDVTRFAVYFAVVLMSHMTSVTFAGLAASVSRDFGAATLVANLSYTVHTFSCGFFIQSEKIPIWLRWLKWTSQVFYGFTAVAYNEFHGRFYACPDTPSSPSNPACIAYTGEFILTSLAIPMVKGSWRLVPILAMVGIMLVYLFGAGLLLHFKKVDITMLGQKKRKEVGGGEVPSDVKDGKQVQEAERMRSSGRGVDVDLARYTLRIRTRSIGLGTGTGKTESTESKTILDGITTTFEAGKVNVILGPSGSGKSSLLNLMAQRLQSSWKTTYQSEGTLSLTLPLSRTTLPASALQSVCSYVTQDDAALLPYLTVRETLYFAAVLRLPSSLVEREKHAKAEEVMMRMGLSDCADTLVGGEGVGGLKGKGISGGERRRVSIAVQVLTEPGVLILDEPTSGLDAATASSIMSVLESLAHIEGRTIITTLHQSSSSLFTSFDNVLLLSKGGGSGLEGGKVIYAGRAEGMLPWLEDAGWPCPRQMNPADFALDVVSVDLREGRREEESRVRVGALARRWQERKVGDATEKVTSGSAPDEGWKSYEKRMSSMATSLPILLKRGWLAFKRQQTLPEARIGNVMGLGIVSAIFFSPLGHDYVSVQDRIGCIQEILPLYFVGMLQNIAVYPMERDIFYREYSDGAYSIESFFVSYLLLELPCEILASLLFSLLTAIATDLTRTVPFFFIVTLNSLCIVNAGESLGIIFNTLLRDNTGLALNVTNVLLSVSTFMAGLMSVDQPAFFKGLNKLSPLGYAVANLVPYSFRSQTFSCADAERMSDGTCVIGTGQDVLEIYKLDKVDPGLNLGAIVITAVVYRLLAYVVLKVRKTEWRKGRE